MTIRKPVRLFALACVLGLAVLAGGCGGGDDTSATADWANDVCSAITTWTGSISAAATSIQSNPSKGGLESVAGDVKESTQTFADDLKGLGKPDTEAGQKAKDSLDSLADELESSVDQIESSVQDAQGASGLLSAVSVVSAALVTMGNEVSSTFQQLEQLDAQGELEDAFKQADSCSALQSNS